MLTRETDAERRFNNQRNKRDGAACGVSVLVALRGGTRSPPPRYAAASSCHAARMHSSAQPAAAAASAASRRARAARLSPSRAALGGCT